MKLVWSRLASADRNEIREYIAQGNPAAALALDELFSEHASRLVDHPGLGRPGRVAGTRELVRLRGTAPRQCTCIDQGMHLHYHAGMHRFCGECHGYYPRG